MYFIAALIAVAFAIHVSLRMRARSWKEALLGLSGYWVVFYAGLLFITTYLPSQIINSERLMTRNWETVVDRGAAAISRSGQPLYDATGFSRPATATPPPSLPLPAAPPTPVPVLRESRIAGQLYTVKAGDTLINLAKQFDTSVSELRTQNSLIGDTILVGQELQVGHEPTTIPTPVTVSQAPTAQPRVIQPTPDLSAYHESLYAARYLGNIVDGRNLITAILDQDSQDAVAINESASIDAAENRLARYATLARMEPSMSIDDTVAAQILQVLVGSTYEITQDGAGLLKPICKEWATVRDIAHGWTYGAEFIVIRCYLAELFYVVQVGDEFSTTN